MWVDSSVIFTVLRCVFFMWVDSSIFSKDILMWVDSSATFYSIKVCFYACRFHMIFWCGLILRLRLSFSKDVLVWVDVRPILAKSSLLNGPIKRVKRLNFCT